MRTNKGAILTHLLNTNFGSGIIFQTGLLLLLIFIAQNLHAQRVPVLNQIDLPHNYYYREMYVPQLTGGPSSACWLPDGKSIIFSMNGSLWKQQIESDTATQLTDGNGYDYQPDCSPDGRKIIFVRYNGTSIELMLLNLKTGDTVQFTQNKAVNLEPRWSPDGAHIVFVSTVNSGHFLLYKAKVEKDKLDEIECLTPDRQSSAKRYYYSAFDHAINPVWSRNGKETYFISNREITHGTGDIVCMNLDSGKSIKTLHHEETEWCTKPDVSPDGSRIVYSSYLGNQWQQLWLLPAKGGYPLQLTYGEYDNTSPRWSSDGKKILFISNRNGNTSLCLVNAYDGGQQPVAIKHLQYLQPGVSLSLRVQNEDGTEIPARISITDSREKFHAPAGAWIQADDSRYPNFQRYESHYFHSMRTCSVNVPKDRLTIIASHGMKYEIANIEIDTRKNVDSTVVITLKRISLPGEFGKWQSGDLHVHMNYGGHYRNTPAKLVEQARCEDVNYVFNLIVNKEQRIPDIKYFSAMPDTASGSETMLLHGQEFHTSFWGHLGLLDLNEHLIIPDYAGYSQTAAESIFPHNSFIANKAHEQNGLVGYAHPFEQSEIFPAQSSALTNELPVDAALGKVDYYELAGFSDHKASEAVWYKLLNCGIHLPAAAGSDAMANYASLRGPVGLTRVYVKQDGPLNKEKFLAGLKRGKSFVTNGPLIGLTVKDKEPGDSILINANGETLLYKAFLRSNVPVDSFEIVLNGEVVARHELSGLKKSVDANGKIKVKGSGWILLRVWSQNANPELFDIYPYASTNPVFFSDGKTQLRSKSSAEYFLKWIDRLEAAVNAHTSYRNEEEKEAILNDLEKARAFYSNQ